MMIIRRWGRRFNRFQRWRRSGGTRNPRTR